MTCEVPLTRGCIALVDDEDYQRVLAAGPWRADVRPSGMVYAKRHCRRLDGRMTAQRLHRFVAGDWPFVDHVNGDGLDNRRSNLRCATKSANGANRGAQRNNTSGFKGVSWHKASQKWIAQMTVNQKTQYIGTFPVLEDAARAYDRAALATWGEFARTNFPREDYTA